MTECWREDCEGVGASSNSIVPANSDAGRRACASRFTAGARPRRGIVVSYEHSGEEWLSGFDGAMPDELTVISVGESNRSTAAAGSDSSSFPELPAGEPRIEGIAAPTDLTALGMTILERVRSYEASGEGEIVLCFDSIDALLEAVPLRTAFRFLHILTALLVAHDVTAHYHLTSDVDPVVLDTI